MSWGSLGSLPCDWLVRIAAFNSPAVFSLCAGVRSSTRLGGASSVAFFLEAGVRLLAGTPLLAVAADKESFGMSNASNAMVRSSSGSKSGCSSARGANSSAAK